MNPPGNIIALMRATPLLLALAGCSPHPATGIWTAAPDTVRGFNRLEITYEGRALLFAVGESEAGRHCFWGGESAQSVAMSCKPAFDTSIEEHYRMTLRENGTATLLRDGEVVAQLSRQTP